MSGIRTIASSFAIAAALFTGTASTQVVWTVGIGKTSCGEALKNIRDKGPAYENHYLTWLGGFISGYNLAVAEKTQGNVRVGEGVTNDQIAALFKKKCTATPQKPLPQVADEIRTELAAFRQ